MGAMKIFEFLKKLFVCRCADPNPLWLEKLEKGRCVAVPNNTSISPVIDTETVLKRISELDERLKRAEQALHQSCAARCAGGEEAKAEEVASGQVER